MKAVNNKEFGSVKAKAKEFACKSIGYGCSWKHIAMTEELLLDSAALHIRDVHGIKALDVEMIGKIRNSFTNPSPAMEYESEIPVMKEFRCKDTGIQCNWHYLAQTEELIVDGAAIHARAAHGVKEFSPEMIASVKKAIREWKSDAAAA